MKVDFTLGRFPVNGEIRERTGALPWSAIVQPCSSIDSHAIPTSSSQAQQPLPSSDQIARCTHCYGYINHYCGFSPSYWLCSLCGKESAFNAFSLHNRYPASDPAKMLTLPEVKGPCFEALVGQPEQVSIAVDEEGVGGVVRGPAPIFIALVDLGSSPQLSEADGSNIGHEGEFLDLVKSSLEAALEALPPSTLFGLITFSSTMMLYDLKSDVATSRTLPLSLPSSSSSSLSQPLSEIMPLQQLLAPILYHKSNIASAIDSLRIDTSSHHKKRGGGGAGARKGGVRALGPCLLSLLDYLQGTRRPPFINIPSSSNQAPSSSSSSSPSGPSVHVAMFLSGPPDEGPGKMFNTISPAYFTASDVNSNAKMDRIEDLSSDARRFYEEASVACASIGACMDLYTICPPSNPISLIALEPLCHNTGGTICLYPSAEESAMPQDVYRRLSGPRACHGLLRLRTSTGFKLSKAGSASGRGGGVGEGAEGAVRAMIRGFGGGHGRMFQDPGIEDLYHVISCDASDAFAFDFEHSGPKLGFAANGTLIPTLQIAFQYSTTTTSSSSIPSSSSTDDGSSENRAGSSVSRGVQPMVVWVQRRLKVLTLRVMVTQDPLDLFKHASLDAILAMLVHRANETVKKAPFDVPPSLPPSSSSPDHRGDQGRPSPLMNQGKLLLRDWLVMAAAGYHRSVASPDQGNRELAALPIDLNFTQAPALTHLTRSVYALIRSPLLSPSSRPGLQHPDLSSFIRQLFTSLPPSDLRPAIYPVLSSWLDADHKAASQLPLRQGSISPPQPSSPSPCIFLIDAYVAVVVLYTKRALESSLPFPPPHSSLIAKEIASIRLDRRISPRVRYVKEGSEEEALFNSLLLDEPDEGQGREANGLDQFLMHVQGESQQFIFNQTN